MKGLRRVARSGRGSGRSWLRLVRRSPNHNPNDGQPDAAPGYSGGSSLSNRSRLGAGYLLLLTLVLALVTGAFLAHLYIRFEGVRLGYETNRARAARTRLLLERRELRLELASLKSPGRVEAEARERLGMEIPDHRRIVSVGKKRKTISVSGGAL